MTAGRDRGAAAVEFALIVPLLLLLVVGIIEFGRTYNTQITLSQAARESVRVMAIEDDAALAKKSAIQAAVSLDPSLMTIGIASRDPSALGSARVDDCAPNHLVTVEITYAFSAVSGIFGPITLIGRGVMRCGG
jgi:Flp pilus assembly protein TadG